MEEKVTVKGRPWVSLNLMDMKLADDMDWRTIQMRLYVGESLVNVVKDTYPEIASQVELGSMDYIQDAITVLHAVSDRFGELWQANPALSDVHGKGAIYTTPTEFCIIGQALDEIDQLQNLVRPLVMAAIYRHVAAEINKKK
jgi:hypothetical protein